MVVSISHRELAAVSAKIKTIDLPIKILSTSSPGLKESFRRGLRAIFWFFFSTSSTHWSFSFFIFLEKIPFYNWFIFELLNIGILKSQMEGKLSYSSLNNSIWNFPYWSVFRAWSIGFLLLSCHDWVMDVYLKSWLVTLIAALDNSLCKHIQRNGEFL